MYIVVFVDVTLVSNAVRAKALSLLSSEEVRRHGRFHHISDADLFLFGRYLARHLIAHLSMRQSEDISIMTDGIATKPYESHRLIEFSISHSGNFVAVAASQRPVGIDIQVHGQTQLDMFDRFFTVKEIDYAHQSFKNFYRLWTSVESLAKITGLGFNEAIMKRTPYFRDELSGYNFNQTDYYVGTLAQTEALTLSVITLEDVVFQVCPSKKAKIHAGIDTDELPADIYFGSVDSDV